jgi:hypothetical protein
VGGKEDEKIEPPGSEKTGAGETSARNVVIGIGRCRREWK